MVEVIVPQTLTVVPGAIGFPTPQLDAVLKNETAFELAQLLPSPEPVAFCEMYRFGPDGAGEEHPEVEAAVVAVPETLPAASTAATPSVYAVPHVRPVNW
jgi:hypothetical protein